MQEMAYTAMFQDCVQAAKSASASDIHVTPTRSGIEIKFRVFGDMQKPWQTLSVEHKQGFMAEVKKRSNLDIGVSGKPQDGRIQLDEWNLDLRANLLPTIYGEKIVLRLLDREKSFDLASLGFDFDTQEALDRAVRYPNGVVLISGPTGSGKTHTLYTLLNSLDREKKNILTLENPVEYTIDGITQVDISKKLSFADALRSVLRQDPDVILVGEVRDEETADLCFKAASTGHLVLSTIHANGATEVISRLINLGVERHLIADNLRFSAAQRLAKKLCGKCSKEMPNDTLWALANQLGDKWFSREGNWRIKSDDGCSVCRKGIAGRQPLLEFMEHDSIKAHINEKGSKPRVSLRASALNAARRGLIEVGEVVTIV